MGRPIRTPEVGELRAFCAAVDLGSLSGAARLLRVTQPALSKRLKSLETLAGARLLERSTRGVTPTPAGARLYEEARRLLTQAEVIQELMAGLVEQDAPVRVAASATAAEFVLPAHLVAYERLHERQVSVEIIVANSMVVRSLVAEGRAEMGVAASDPDTPHPGLHELPLIDDEIVAAVPPGHPWRDLEQIAIDDLVQTPLALRDPGADSHRRVARELTRLGHSLAPALAEVGSTEALRRTALAEGVPALISLLALGEDDALAVRRVEGLRLTRRFAILIAGGVDTLRPATHSLVQHLLRATAGAGEPGVPLTRE